MQSSMVMMLSRDEVPAFLRTGAFFQNLDSSDEERFVVPTNRYKADPSVNNTADLMLLLQAASFWGLEEPPLTVVSYVVQNNKTLNTEYLQSEFPEYATFLAGLFHLGMQRPKLVVLAAINAGMKLNVIKQLHKHDGFPVDSSALLVVVEQDNLPCFKWLQALSYKLDQQTVLCMLEHGSLQCMRHAMENGLPLRSGAVACAAHFEKLEMVKYLLSLGIKTELGTLKHVLHKGNVEIMRILRQAGCEWPHDALERLIINNRLDGLILAHKDGLPLTSRLCVFAAKHGHLSCLEYLHAQGCPWDEHTTRMAVTGGHLDCLKFALQHSCPMSPLLIRDALYYGRYALIPYCMWHGVMDIHFIVCCAAWACAILLRFILWWTGQCANTIFRMAGLWVIFSTIELTCGMIEPILVDLIQLFVVLVAVKTAWDLLNNGVVCLP